MRARFEHIKLGLFLVTSIFVFSGVGVGCAQDASSNSAESGEPGYRITEDSLNSTLLLGDGSETTLSSILSNDKPVLLYYLTTW